AIVAEAIAAGLVYVGDPDSRPRGSAHPLGNLWDTGEEPVASLEHMMTVRRLALARFGLDNIRQGQPISQLQEVIVPLYLFHRYQVEAATKPLGGMFFSYGVKGDLLPGTTFPSPDYQRRALAAVLASLEPVELDLSDRVLDLLLPRHRGFGDGQYSREMFRSKAFPAFDLMGAADVAADLTFGHLLHPARLGRLVEFHRRNEDNPSLEEVLGIIDQAVFVSPNQDQGRLVELRHVVQERLVSHLIGLLGNAALMPAAGERIEAYLAGLSRRLKRGGRRARAVSAHYASLSGRIDAVLGRPAPAEKMASRPARRPPGSPIGGETGNCWLCLDDKR
ncbi:MAG: zinc-dependent metalloprotease, partial [Sphingomonadales bacterium]